MKKIGLFLCLFSITGSLLATPNYFKGVYVAGEYGVANVTGRTVGEAALTESTAFLGLKLGWKLNISERLFVDPNINYTLSSLSFVNESNNEIYELNGLSLFGLNVGYYVTERIYASLGYTISVTRQASHAHALDTTFEEPSAITAEVGIKLDAHQLVNVGIRLFNDTNLATQYFNEYTNEYTLGNMMYINYIYLF